jgi:hypothetical protein
MRTADPPVYYLVGRPRGRLWNEPSSPWPGKSGTRGRQREVVAAGWRTVRVRRKPATAFTREARARDWPCLARRGAECLNEPAVGLPTPIVLAGGLTPDNVTQALAVVNPYAVDVSGGVERDKGVRDEDKMRRFISGVWDVGRG